MNEIALSNWIAERFPESDGRDMDTLLRQHACRPVDVEAVGCRCGKTTVLICTSCFEALFPVFPVDEHECSHALRVQKKAAGSGAVLAIARKS
jgi:hypothetical protein